jgi:hypothetical protein
MGYGELIIGLIYKYGDQEPMVVLLTETGGITQEYINNLQFSVEGLMADWQIRMKSGIDSVTVVATRNRLLALWSEFTGSSWVDRMKAEIDGVTNSNQRLALQVLWDEYLAINLTKA